jgi:Flp pilus assembly protein TadD
MKRVRFLSYYVFLFLAGIAFADPTGRVRGVVKDADGKPLEGVIITLTAQGDMPQTYTAHTDKKGGYIHIGVRPGDYRIVPSKEGFTPVNYAYIDAHVGVSEKALTADFVMAPQAVVKQQAAEKQQPDTLEDARRGIALLDEGKVDDAIAAFQKAIGTNPDNAGLHYNLGVAFEKKDNLEEAQKQYQEAAKLKPDMGEAFLALGNSLLTVAGTAATPELKNKKFEEAAEALKKATELIPQSYPAFYNLGVAYSNGGKYVEAEGAYRKACEVSPNEPVAHYQLGMSLLGQSKNAEAKAEFQKYLELNPNAADKAEIQDLLNTLQ